MLTLLLSASLDCTDPVDTSPAKDSAVDSVSTDTGESGDTGTDTVDSETDSPTDTVVSGWTATATGWEKARRHVSQRPT